MSTFTVQYCCRCLLPNWHIGHRLNLCSTFFLQRKTSPKMSKHHLVLSSLLIIEGSVHLQQHSNHSAILGTGHWKQRSRFWCHLFFMNQFLFDVTLVVRREESLAVGTGLLPADVQEWGADKAGWVLRLQLPECVRGWRSGGRLASVIVGRGSQRGRSMFHPLMLP